MSAVPIHLIREKRLIRIFEAAGATEPFNAAALQDLNIDQNRAFVRLQQRGVVIESSPGRFYVDLERVRSIRKTRLIAILVVLLVAMGLAIYSGLRVTDNF